MNLPIAVTGESSYGNDYTEPPPAYDIEQKLDQKPDNKKFSWTDDFHPSPDPLRSAPGSDLFYNGYAPTHIPSSNKHPSQVGKFAGGKSTQNLLNPPPACFSRTPPSDQQYPEFEMITIPSLGHQYLAKGFPATLPQTATRPHPFSTHDVTEKDWMHFLADLKAAGSLGWSDRIVFNIAPALLGTAFLPALLLSEGIERKQKMKKRGPVMELIQNWNACYWNPRYMEVTVVQAGGTIMAPPPMVQPYMQSARPGSDVDIPNSIHGYSHERDEPHDHKDKTKYPGQLRPSGSSPSRPSANLRGSGWFLHIAYKHHGQDH
ncbi:hypothetical protein DICSQDRAFT_174789 [Dichomitus squalens LYAD-421 SS1]|uniref:Uncharacterized protein n=1 Tax=Dichomitus squalens (strain LYAD-421) TaxID=732165 RepID=R7SK86_DICSQ|nr:uncharacterized protein DICSQDRAFT_174789 [Dichomitus squalens LYAD-421 SS1]EJF56561.1 hypothetical protein DICSQDRAFT_174789 [Dichomitus squalens LYAD-421 SS1]